MSGVIWPDDSGVIAPGSLRDGFFVKYNSGSQAKITSGVYEANGKKYVLTTEPILAFTGIPSAFTRYYIYIDDDASTPPTPTFIYSTTAPVWNDAKNGWYNGDDLCIGIQLSENGTTVLAYHDMLPYSGRAIEYVYGDQIIPALAASMSPNASWQTPNQNESSAVIPVNSIGIRLFMFNTDTTPGVVGVFASSTEAAAIHTTITNTAGMQFRGYQEATLVLGFPLGASRNIKIAGESDDDNFLSATCMGFTIER